MKKILLFLTVCMAALLTSCSNGPKSVYEKIQSGKELTQDDYTVMIEYSQEAMKACPLMDEKAMNSNDIEAIDKKMEEWKKKYEYSVKFGMVLEANIDKLDEKNKKMMDEMNKELMGDSYSSEDFGESDDTTTELVVVDESDE